MTAEFKSSDQTNDAASAEKASDGLNTIKRGLQSVASEAVRGAKQTLVDHAGDAKKAAQSAGAALSEQTKARPLVLLALTFLAGFALAEATRRRY